MSEEKNLQNKIEKAVPASVDKKSELIAPKNEREPDIGWNPFERGKAASEISAVENDSGSIVARTNAASQSNVQKKEIEKVLEKNLEEIYMNLAPDVQKKFRNKGEATASEINKMLEQAKVSLKKIIELIKSWLSVIPGVNKFFLEQEAKIKADEIIKISRK